MIKCSACDRKSLPNAKYCQQHKQASDNIASHYKTWIKAYGEISWTDFLIKLLKMEESGTWVKEVIEVELKK